jgi:signal transduction histidine kinase
MQRFSQLIFKQINATLATAGATIAISIWVYAFYQVNVSRKHAELLLMSQAVGVSRAAVIEGNSLAIQPALERFINDWNQAEPLEARTEVKLDNTLVAKAGPAHPFRRFFSTMNEKIELPSGSVLQIRTDLEHGKYWLQVIGEIAALEALILTLFLLLKRKISRVVAELSEPLEETTRWIQEIARGLPDSARKVTDLRPSRILEVESVRESVATLAREISGLEEKLTRTSFDRGRLQMADQVVHDIRSPLGTLDMWVAAAKSVSSEEKESVRGPIRRIQDIINTLLSLRRQDHPSRGENPEVSFPLQAKNSSTLLLPLIEQVVSEKRLRYSNRTELKIEGPEAQNCYEVSAEVDSTEFQRMLSNLIDNAVESIPSDGWIIVKLSQEEYHVLLEVSDTGKGMTEDEMERVLTLSESIDKPGGSGMGLKHARKMATAWKGELSLSSTPGLGCNVRVTLPRSSLPAGLLGHLDLSNVSTVVIVDDDPTIHALWNSRWIRLGLGAHVALRHVYKPGSLFLGSSPARLPDHTIYLIDYDLGPGEMSGTDLIQAEGLAQQAVLVTSRYADSTVATQCERLKINRLPKSWASFIPIHKSSEFEKASGNPIRQGEDVFSLLTSKEGPSPRASSEVVV